MGRREYAEEDHVLTLKEYPVPERMQQHIAGTPNGCCSRGTLWIKKLMERERGPLIHEWTQRISRALTGE